MTTPVAQALAHALLHSLWEGAAIALVLALLLYISRTSSARLRYGLACGALFALPAAFVVTFWLSLPPPLPRPAIATAFPIPFPIPNPADRTPVHRPGADLAWLVPLWFTGVACFYLYGLAGWIGGQRLRRVGVCAASIDWQQRLDALSARLGIARPVVLLESCLANTPVVIGVLRPVILAPLGILTGLPTEQVESILIHELAHIRRNDYLVNLVQRLVEGLLFYHPAVWWISNIVRTEREFCCDDLVVELNGDPRSYAEALSTLEQRRWTAIQAALAANGGNLMTRMKRLLQQQEAPRVAAAPVAGLLLLLACAGLAAWEPRPQPQIPTAAPMANAAPITPPPPERPRLMAQAKSLPRPVVPASPPAAATQLPSPYQKWLNEEVVYIITGNERSAFGRLTTDDERQSFIEQFWLRRDPTPGTAENEFQEEHYRRIQWANDRFAGTQPGWMSDRGKIYISYGPPDDIDVHSGAADAPAYQIWHYRHIDGVGDDVIMEFVDRSGDYRLTIDPNRLAQGPVVFEKGFNGSNSTFFFEDFERRRKRTLPEIMIHGLKVNTPVPAPPPAR